MAKSLEQRLYEAYRSERGITLSERDVFHLVFDDAIGCRISNACAIEHGRREPGADCIRPLGNILPTWRQLSEQFDAQPEEQG